jgi:hypothetical protein
MKTVSIGDTHGTEVADIVLKIINNYDKFIFVGDYVDSFFFDNVTMKKNLLDIIELKIKYPEKVTLLWGNHDIQYLLGYAQYGCTGYRPEMGIDFYEIFHSNESLFQLSFQEGDYLWTHAGIHAGWFEHRFKPFTENHNKVTVISEQLNIAFNEGYSAIFDVGFERGGMHNIGGPLWCDKSELISKPLKDINQIVGHSRVKQIRSIKKSNIELVFTDVLENEEIITEESFYYKEL